MAPWASLGMQQTLRCTSCSLQGHFLQQQGCGGLWQAQQFRRTVYVCAAGSPAAAGLRGAEAGVAGLLADCLCRSSSCRRVAACALRSAVKSAPSASAR